MSAPAQHIAGLADQCVQCGLCLPSCPTYGLDRNEAESPRGRIALASALARGVADPTEELRQHLDHCLGCLNCENACPAQVRYGELLFGTRAMLGPPASQPRRLVALLRRPRLLRRLRRLASWIALAQWKGGLARCLPASSPWRAALLNLPGTTPARSVRATKRGGAIALLALFPGCIASVEDAQAQQAAVALLQAAGFGVSVLPAMCCGAMDLHAGASAAAEQAAQQVRDAFNASGARQLLSITPGCLGTLRRALPGVEVVDPLTVLAAHASSLRFRPLAQRIALHLPCTQINVARSESAVQLLLRRIAQLDVATLPRAPYCCGAAGTHMLEFPQRAAILRDETLQQARTLDSELLLSCNIGCRLHLATGIEQQNLPWTTMHPLTLLARQLEHPEGVPLP